MNKAVTNAGARGVRGRWRVAGLAWLALAGSVMSGSGAAARTNTLVTLLAEMTDPAAVARFPVPAYRSLQASSYNRESVHRDRPGWFADSDGVGFIREENAGGRREWVVMEHEGPGCLTKIWTPYFYYDLENRTGPNIRVYLDGATEPVIDEGLIALVSGKGSVKPPFAAFTARAGNLYLPIPFARSCRVTLTSKPFYNIINYRAYPEGTPVRTFSWKQHRDAKDALAAAARALTRPPERPSGVERGATNVVRAGRSLRVMLPEGPGAVRQFVVELPAARTNAALLRTAVLEFTFDGRPTVWCPLGDFFGSADALHPFDTWQRSVSTNGVFTGRWMMPYEKRGELRVSNRGTEPFAASLRTIVQSWSWDADSLHFHARWRPEEVVPGTPFRDWNFVSIEGRGVYVGDAWTVLNPQRNTWWGEGDEKIYVDDAWDAGFPTHFGTGTEDYYGWAGGVLPTRADEFDEPFLANVRVGGVDGHTQGYNISTRTRSLDAIPFRERFRIDLESSFGTDIRNPWNLLGYSAVTFWYARPGARANRPEQPEAVARPILSLEEIAARSEAIRAAASK